jgi:hypothetical protein
VAAAQWFAAQWFAVQRFAATGRILGARLRLPVAMVGCVATVPVPPEAVAGLARPAVPISGAVTMLPVIVSQGTVGSP